MLVNKENISALAEEIIASVNTMGTDDLSVDVNDTIALIKLVGGEYSGRSNGYRGGHFVKVAGKGLPALGDTPHGTHFVMFVNGVSVGPLRLLSLEGEKDVKFLEGQLARIIASQISDKVDDITSNILCKPDGLINGSYISKTVTIRRCRETKFGIQIYQIIVNGELEASGPHDGSADQCSWFYMAARNVIHAAAMTGEYDLTVFE